MKLAISAALAALALAACAGIPNSETLVYANGEPCTQHDRPGFGSLGPTDYACLTKKEWRIAKAERSEKSAYAENRRTDRQNVPRSYARD